MPHCHLSLNLSYCFKDNADYDEQRRASEGERADLRACADIDYQRYYRDYTEEERSDKSNSVKNSRYIIGGGLTGTDTRDKAAVLLKVIRNLYGIKGYKNIEIREKNYQYEEEYSVYPGIVREHVEELIPEAALLYLGLNYHLDGAGYRNYGVSENDRHNAAHVKLYRESSALTAVHLTADDLLCILNGETALAVGNEHNECDHSQRAEYHELDYNEVPGALHSIRYERGSLSHNSRNDVSEEDYGDTVSDTLLVYLFSEPHDKRCTCRVAEYDYESAEHGVTGRGKEAGAVLHVEIVAERGKERKRYGNDSRYLRYLLLSLLAALAESLKRGDRYRKKLHNDRCGYIR